MALVGGVGELYQGDLDLGRRAAERLAGADLGPHAAVEELHYGAVAVAQRLEDLRPHTLVLVGAVARGREPGTVERRRIGLLDLDPAEVQVSVCNAVTGYVTIDLVVEVAWGLSALPPRTITVEVEPATVAGPATQLSAQASAGLDEACRQVREEVRRAPLLRWADQARAELRAGGAATPANQEGRRLWSVLEELHRADMDGDGEGVDRSAAHLRRELRGGSPLSRTCLLERADELWTDGDAVSLRGPQHQ